MSSTNSLESPETIPLLVTHKSSAASARLYFFLTASHNYQAIKNISNVELLYIVNRELANGLLKIGISHENIFYTEDFHSYGADVFERIFVNYSPNPIWYELLCFLRYFWALELCTRKGYDRIIISDSDNLFFPVVSNLKLLGKENTYLDFSGDFVTYQNDTHKFVAGGLMIFTKEDLSRFCDHVITQYTDIKNIEDIYKSINFGGVCDMTLLTIWDKNNAYDLTTNLNSIGLNFDRSMQHRLKGSKTNLQPGLIFSNQFDNADNWQLNVFGQEKPQLKLVNLQFSAQSKNIIWGICLYSTIISIHLIRKYIPLSNSSTLLRIILALSQLRASVFIHGHRFLVRLRHLLG